MSSKTGSKFEYIIVAMLDEYEPGDKLIDWPLHVTIIPWFTLYNSAAKFKNETMKLLGGTGAIRLTVGDMFYWGQHKVNIIDYSVTLHRLHEQMLRLARESGRMLVRERFLGRDFTPHVTHQGTQSAGSGRCLNIENIYILKKHMNRRQKTVVAKINL